MQASDWPELTRSNLNDEVYALLRRGILSGQLAPGARLNLRELETRLGVSRTPLIRALDRLTAEGLMEVRPSRGTYVADPTPDEVTKALDLRQVLEIYAIEQLVPRITEAQLDELRTIVEQLRALAPAQESAASHERYIQQDYAFHAAVVRLAENPLLFEFWDRTRARWQVIRALYRMRQSELDEAKAVELATVQPEHEAILQALQDRDVARLRQIIAKHIEDSKQWAIQVLERH
ncbi:MAG: GntR family transcriptional regulator [Chloroflexi bacterium]|nr:GntR family transcriptional regulator [Chloroflexota bacterium]